MRSARSVARAASQIDLQLLELGDGLIDALVPFLGGSQTFGGNGWIQDGQLLGDFLEVETCALRERDVDDPVKDRVGPRSLQYQSAHSAGTQPPSAPPNEKPILQQYRSKPEHQFSLGMSAPASSGQSDVWHRAAVGTPRIGKRRIEERAQQTLQTIRRLSAHESYGAGDSRTQQARLIGPQLSGARALTPPRDDCPASRNSKNLAGRHFKQERHSADQDHIATDIYEALQNTSSAAPRHRGPRGPVMEIWRSRIVVVSIKMRGRNGRTAARPTRGLSVSRGSSRPRAIVSGRQDKMAHPNVRRATRSRDREHGSL
jgi:hypothetical protein